MSDEKKKTGGKLPIEMGNKSEAGEYRVGRGKPPKEHQFKPGWQGGPGRPPGSGQLLKALIEKLNQEVTDERGQKALWKDVIVEALFVTAAKGNATLIRELLDRESGRVPLPIEIPPEGSATYSERIAALFNRLDQKSKQKEKPEDGTPDTPESAPGPDAGKA